jgi:N-acetylmuramoyl-L-alanine amidase
MGQYMQIIVNEWLGSLLLKIGAATELNASLPKGDDAKPVPPVKRKQRILINPGHSGTKGASGKNPKIQETLENETQAYWLRKSLTEMGFTADIVRQTQFNGDLLATGKAAKGYDMFLALHQNAFDGAEHGAEVMVGAKPTEASLRAAKLIGTAMAKALGIKDRGPSDRSVSVITGAQSVGCPVVLLTESQFIDDETDLEEVRRETLLSAEAIAKAIGEFYA